MRGCYGELDEQRASRQEKTKDWKEMFGEEKMFLDIYVLFNYSNDGNDTESRSTTTIDTEICAQIIRSSKACTNLYRMT
jgi:hypothetical protein